MAKKYKATIFLLLLFIYGINSAESDPVNCKEIQCPPPEIIENCPEDSILTDKFDLITTLLTIIPTTPTFTTATPSPTTTSTIKTTIPENISVKSVNEIIYNDKHSNETESIEITTNSLTSSQFSTKFNEPITDETIINNTTKGTITIQSSSVTSIDFIDTDSVSSSISSSEISIIDTNNNNITKKPRKYRKRGRKIPKLTTEQTNEPSITKETDINESSHHMLEKRSLRSYQHESIKIVPGGYISYKPKILNYRQYNHGIWKRNALPSLSEQFLSTKLPTYYQRQMCCPKKECTCIENGCTKPMCVNPDYILVEIKNGSNIPGQCCPKYECIEHEPECTDNVSNGKPYWLSKCEKCHCIRGIKFCYAGCPPPVKPRNCYSNALQQSFPHGRKWKEDDCATCECVDGRMDCLTTFCKNPNCKKQIKIPGQCCRICEENILTTITTILPKTTDGTQHTTSLPDYVPDNNIINLTTTTTVPSMTTSKSDINSSDSIFSVISENIIMVIFITIVIVVVVAGIIGIISRKCKQRVYEPVKKSESTNSSQTQEKPNGLKTSNSQ